MIYLFPFGSHMYQLTNFKSDRDYLAIVVDEPKPKYIDTGFGNTEIEIWSLSEFNDKLEKCDLKALEVFYEYFDICKNFISFTMNENLLDSLRRSVSATVSNAHVKAKKKIRDGEIYIGLKSYFHCIRILTMFDYLAKNLTFKPSSFKSLLEYSYLDIINRENTDPISMFNLLENDYKYLLKSLQHSFRLNCPKNINI